MGRIDSHQHFWAFDPVRDAWVKDGMAVLRKDFLPEDLEPALEANHVSGCVAVQADQSEAETHFLLDLANMNPFILGVVGWVDLQQGNLGGRLKYFSQFAKLKGFRHIVQAEDDPGFLSRPAFLSGVALLGEYGLTYDVLVKPHQLDATAAFVEKFPNQFFVINHLAKPYIAKGERDPWAAQMRVLASHENVYCKLSGMVTEADLQHWKQEDFSFYIQHVLDVFGPERVMFGSDWPVCLLGAEYTEVVDIVEQELDSLTPEEKASVWGETAKRFYKL